MGYDFSGFDPARQVAIDTRGCGYGKTHDAVSLAEDGLLASLRAATGLDIQPNRTLFICSRTAIREQTSLHYDTVFNPRDAEGLNEYLGGFGERIAVVTYQSFASWLGSIDAGAIECVIVDEFHQLFSDSTFAGSAYAVRKFLNETGAARIALTATPDELLRYRPERVLGEWQERARKQFPFEFKEVASSGKPQYRFESITVFEGGWNRLLETFRGTEDARTVVFHSSAESALRALGKGENASFIASKWNERYRDSRDGETYDCLIRNKKLPQDIYELHLTSFAEVGLDLKDERVKTIIVDSFLPHEVKQYAGRFRNDVPRLIIHAPKGRKSQILKDVGDATRFLERLELMRDDDARQVLMEERYSSQSNDIAGGAKVPPIVGRWKGRYEVDWAVFAHWVYEYESFLAATNYCHENEDVSFLGRQLKHRRVYYREMLAGYSENPIEFVYWDGETSAEYRNRDALGRFDFTPYLNRNLDPEQQRELAEAVGLRNGQGHPTGWRTLERRLKSEGYSVEPKRIGNRRYKIIERP